MKTRAKWGIGVIAAVILIPILAITAGVWIYINWIKDDPPPAFSLDDSASGRFAIDATTGVVTIANAALLDFENAAQHTIVVRASDASGAFSTESFTIDVRDDPTDTPNTWLVSVAWTKWIITGGSNQTVNGSAGNDFMDGGKGMDKTIGGAGDDTHYIRDAGDNAVERPNEGIDTALVSIRAYTLGANVENLTSTYGSGGVYVGNSLNNIMTGGASSDVLTGGFGADLFVASRGNDKITDFDGGPVRAGAVVAAAPGIADSFLELVASAGAADA